METPAAIAINIQSVRWRSKKLSCFLWFAGAQLFEDIFNLIILITAVGSAASSFLRYGFFSIHGNTGYFCIAIFIQLYFFSR